MISPLDHHLLRAYLDGEMDEATSTAFEIRLMERPDLAELVEADTLLGMGLRAALAPSAAANDTAAAAKVVPLAEARKPERLRGFSPARASGFLAAAGVVLAVGVLAGRMTRPVPAEPAAAEPVTIVQVDATRGVPAPPALNLTVPRSGKTVLAVAFEDARRCTSRVTITQPDHAPLEGEANIESSGFANIVVDASRLAEGDGRVVAVCVDGSARRVYSVKFAH